MIALCTHAKCVIFSTWNTISTPLPISPLRLLCGSWWVNGPSVCSHCMLNTDYLLCYIEFIYMLADFSFVRNLLKGRALSLSIFQFLVLAQVLVYSKELMNVCWTKMSNNTWSDLCASCPYNCCASEGVLHSHREWTFMFLQLPMWLYVGGRAFMEVILVKWGHKGRTLIQRD